MRVDIVTLFPGLFEAFLSEGIVRRARERGILNTRLVNPRDFASDRRGTVDDRPYGGGAGMLLMAEPLYRALRKALGPGSAAAPKGRVAAKGRRGAKVVLLSPQGRRFDQGFALRLAKERHLVLVCGRYEGVDERILDYVDMELSIGDFVLTGGEVAAMAVVDALTRLLPGVLAKPEAVRRESFSGALLDYPQFTRPRVWRGRRVPRVLLSGDHARIEAWRMAAALKATRRKRPGLLTGNGGLKKARIAHS